jgi:hypothetical protein
MVLAFLPLLIVDILDFSGEDSGFCTSELQWKTEIHQQSLPPPNVARNSKTIYLIINFYPEDGGSKIILRKSSTVYQYKRRNVLHYVTISKCFTATLTLKILPIKYLFVIKKINPQKTFYTKLLEVVLCTLSKRRRQMYGLRSVSNAMTT